jgi:hypothetical protein
MSSIHIPSSNWQNCAIFSHRFISFLVRIEQIDYKISIAKNAVKL